VKTAIDEYLKRKKIEKIKSMKGKLEFSITADEIRHPAAQGGQWIPVLLISGRQSV